MDQSFTLKFYVLLGSLVFHDASYFLMSSQSPKSNQLSLR